MKLRREVLLTLTAGLVAAAVIIMPVLAEEPFGVITQRRCREQEGELPYQERRKARARRSREAPKSSTAREKRSTWRLSPKPCRKRSRPARKGSSPR